MVIFTRVLQLNQRCPCASNVYPAGKKREDNTKEAIFQLIFHLTEIDCRRSNFASVTHKCPVIDSKSRLQIHSPYQAGISYFPLPSAPSPLFLGSMWAALPHVCGRDQRCRLTLSLPEDSRAHELEEAARIKAGPVHWDRVLRTGRENASIRQWSQEYVVRTKGSFIKAAVSDLSKLSAYPIVHQGLPWVFQLFNEPGEEQEKEKSCHKRVHLHNNFSFMLDQAWDASISPPRHKLRLF